MSEPFEPEIVRDDILAILDGSGMTVFTRRLKEECLKHDMTSLDAVNVLRGGRIWRYQARTQRMTVEFSFRSQGAFARPNELVIETARRNK